MTSDNVGAVGYDHSAQVLRVRFRSGGTYDYYDVPVHLFEVITESGYQFAENMNQPPRNPPR